MLGRGILAARAQQRCDGHFVAKARTDVVLDSNQDSTLRINFDVTMFDMNCDHVTVGVWDAFGTERQNITKDAGMCSSSRRSLEPGIRNLAQKEQRPGKLLRLRSLGLFWRCSG